MYIHEIQKPKAWAILDQRNVTIYNFSKSDTVTILRFLSIPAFQDVLISKYDNSVEIIITIKKTYCLSKKIERLNRLCNILVALTDTSSAQVSNTLQSYSTHEILTIKLTLDAINQ